MNGTLASPAVALARSVLPVPGGPDNIAPCKSWNIIYKDSEQKHNMYTVTHFSSYQWQLVSRVWNSTHGSVMQSIAMLNTDNATPRASACC